MCSGRADAVERGAFWWDFKVGGYVSSDIATRESNWRAKYYTGDMTGERYRLERCPYCGIPLPDKWPDDLHEGRNPRLGQCDGDGAE
jgi:hypothetical protein